jgi:hypothetical protein
MNILFDRLSLQGHFKRVIETYGESQGLDLIREALARELKYRDLVESVKYSYDKH